MRLGAALLRAGGLLHTSASRPFSSPRMAADMQGPPKRPRRAHDLIGEEMKSFEAETCDRLVDLTRPCVIRLDGHCFHTFTRGFRRPYDTRIHEAMAATATDLLERFGAVTAYTESDEISLLFPPSEGDTVNLPFNGRVQKVVSVTAGFASARFNHHMLAQPFDRDDPHEV